MAGSQLIFRTHAIQRMFQRGINVEDVRAVIQEGRTIEDYPDDFPFPSRLVLGFCGARPIHVVVADRTGTDQVVIITVYEPSVEKWDANFSKRRKI